MSAFPVILDANVLVPASLRDTLLGAAEAGLYRVHWSATILDEVRRTLLRLRNATVTDAQADGLLAIMEAAFPGARVEGYQPLIGAMPNDEKDRHVAAAAVTAGAHMIVTLNTKHFPPEALNEFGVEVQHPDAFLTGLFELSPDVMMSVIEDQAARLRRPPTPIERVLDHLGLFAPTFVEQIRVARQRRS